MSKCKYLGQLVVIALTLLMGGCATTSESDTQSETTTPAAIDYIFPIDLKTVVNNLVDALLKSHAIGYSQPLVAFGEINDKTNTHLDTKAISDQIRTQLTSSGKVRLVADNNDDKGERIKGGESSHRQDNGHPPAHRFSKLKATNYRLIGVVYDTPTKKYDIKEQYYRLTLSLLDMDNGELIWIEEKENIEHRSSR
ncbi:penicillin-binding protein activator [Gammaproteobacteria bacterium]